MDRHPWQPVAPTEPVPAPIQGNIEPVLRPREKQILSDGILLDRMDKSLHVRGFGDPPPVTPVVVRQKNEGLAMTGAMRIESDDSRPGPDGRGFDVGDPTAVRDPIDSTQNAHPLPASRSGNLNVPLVRADPNHIRIDRTRRDYRDGGATSFWAPHSPGLRRETVGIDNACRLAAAGRIVGGQVTADDLPRLAPIHAPVNELTPVENGGRIVRVERDRHVPVEAKGCQRGRPRPNVLPFARLKVETNEASAPRDGIPATLITRIDQNSEVVVVRQFDPVRTWPSATPPQRRSPPRSAALQSSVYVEGDRHVDRHMVETTERKLTRCLPMFAAVSGHIEATVASSVHEARVLGVNPQDPITRAGTECVPSECGSAVLAQGQLRSKVEKPRLVQRIRHDRGGIVEGRQ